MTTNRVLLSSSGLKVSKSSVDVLTAGPGDLLLNSDYPQLGYYQTGNFTVPTTWQSTSTPHRVLDYDRTFDAPPLIIMSVRSGSSRVPVGAGRMYFKESYHDPSDPAGDARYICGVSRTDGLDVFAWTNGPSDGYHSWTFDYFVMQYGVAD